MAYSFRDILVKQIEARAEPQVQTTYPRVGCLASETLAGSSQWNASDGDVNTYWSSNSFPSSTNSRGANFAGYLPAGAIINTVLITAAQTSGVFEGFPAKYKVNVTDPANTKWIATGQRARDRAARFAALYVRSVRSADSARQGHR